LAPSNLKIGDIINPLNIKQIGTSHKLQDLNIGTYIYNIELKPNQGGKLIKSAGTYGQIIQKQKKYSKIKLPSGEQRLILNTCFANIGKVANNIFKNIKLKKAGNKRWLGKRPKVRGVAMNPVDHPHGGGEGKTSGGRHPVSPWGKLTKGKKTVKKKNKYIILKRTKKQK
jgi:large subunit ribosomal protein L2